MKETLNISEKKCVSFKIFEKARELFNKIGVRNTTMDDLAKELGISKKTLYKEIDNKADLVKLCVQSDLSEMEQKVNKIAAQYDNAIEELLMIGVSIKEDLQLYHPTVLHDITKFYPESRDLIENHKKTFAYTNIIKNLDKGIAQGLYRADINTSLIAQFQLHLSLLPFEMNNEKYSTAQLYHEILKYNIYAIATPKGVNMLEELLNKQSNLFL